MPLQRPSNALHRARARRRGSAAFAATPRGAPRRAVLLGRRVCFCALRPSAPAVRAQGGPGPACAHITAEGSARRAHGGVFARRCCCVCRGLPAGAHACRHRGAALGYVARIEMLRPQRRGRDHVAGRACCPHVSAQGHAGRRLGAAAARSSPSAFYRAAPDALASRARLPVVSVRQVILYAQLRDNSQGVIKITTGAAGRDTAAGAVLVEHETKLSGAPAAAVRDNGGCQRVACVAGQCALLLLPCADSAFPCHFEARLNGRLNSGAVVVARAAELAADKAAAHGFGERRLRVCAVPPA
jgi:hypothetical protein